MKSNYASLIKCSILDWRLCWYNVMCIKWRALVTIGKTCGFFDRHLQKYPRTKWQINIFFHSIFVYPFSQCSIIYFGFIFIGVVVIKWEDPCVTSPRNNIKVWQMWVNYSILGKSIVRWIIWIIIITIFTNYKWT